MALLIAHWTFLVAAMAAFGSALFPFYSFPGRERERGARLTRPLVLVGAAATLVAATAWFVFLIVDFGGDNLVTFASTAHEVLFATPFGPDWLVRLIAGVFLVALATLRRPESGALVFLAAIVLGSEAWIGHPAAGGTTHCFVQCLHVVPAGAWLGGLVPLSLVLARSRRTPAGAEQAAFALTRFSVVGMVCVGLILISGIFNIAFVIGRVPDFSTAYDEILLAKLALFLVLILVAGINRFMLLPRLRRDATGEPAVLATFSRTVLAEQALGLLLLLVASILGASDPSA